MEEKLREIQEYLNSHAIDEILKLNLLSFFSLEDKYTLEELEEKYEKEELNELRKSIKYFRDSIIDIKQNMDEYLWVYNTLIEEEKSKTVFVNMLYAKVFMSIDSIEEAYSDEIIYYDGTIFGQLSNEIYIDCGGYTGDTALQFISNCTDYAKVFVYEPLPELAKECSDNLDYFIKEGNLNVYNNAVYERKEKLHFAKELGNGDSCIKDKGELVVQAISLDEEIEEPISFIKMDIEGSEKDAILGARNHIINDTPKMAVCIYHLADDFWKIPQLIYKINNNYNFIIRQHLIDGFAETVLYCVPKIKNTSDNVDVDDNVKCLRRYKQAIKQLSSYYKQENLKMMRLIKDKSWFLPQLRNYRQNVENKKNSILELKEWTKELNNGKEYLANRVEELEQWTKELQEAKNYLEKRQNELEDEVVTVHDYIDSMEKQVSELKNKNSKLQYKYNKVINDTLIKKIIKWKKYDV